MVSATCRPTWGKKRLKHGHSAAAIAEEEEGVKEEEEEATGKEKQNKVSRLRFAACRRKYGKVNNKIPN